MGATGTLSRNLITQGSSDYGSPGLYEVHRSGDLSAPNGMIFLSASFGDASNYGKDTNGNIDTYQIQLNNPLVVTGDTDVAMLRKAYSILNPDRRLPTGGITSKKWQQMDKQNASALNKSQYDGIIYKKNNGRHEVQISKKRVNELKQTKTTKHSGKLYDYKGDWI